MVNIRIKPLPPLSVRMKILLIFLALSGVILIVMGIAAIISIGDIGGAAQERTAQLGNEAIKDSTAALRSETQEYMLRIASDQARLIDELFAETRMELDLLKSHALSLQNNPSYSSSIRAYPASTPPENPLDGSVVLLAPNAVIGTDSEEYRALAGMDDLLAAVNRTDPDNVKVYVVSDSGIMRMYPGDPPGDPSYDPRTRSWFVAAKASDNPVWTDPYVDASGHGLLVTCAERVQTKFGTWVVASDITVDQLNEFTSMTLGGRGYAILMDQDGNVISRPGLSANGTTWDQPFPLENVLNSTDPGLVAVGRNMTSGKTGVEMVRFNGTATVVAYAPVKSLNWSYAVSMPALDIAVPIFLTEAHIGLVTRQTSEEILRQTDRLLVVFAGLGLLLLLLVILLSWYLAQIITRPVDALRQGTQIIGSGDLDFRLDIRSGDEFEELARSFNTMAADLRTSIEVLKKTTAEKERYTREMEIAKEIQDSFLPESVPKIPGFDVAAVTIPAMEIGGDLYDFIPVGHNRTGFVIADVSGKGVSAALYMALSRTLLHASAGSETDPAPALQKANMLIYGDGRSSMFITVFYGVLDPETMQFAYVNAGHNPPLLVRNGESGTWLTGEKGIALGVVPDAGTDASVIMLMPGDLMVLYTDGVTENFNERDEYYGEERFRECVVRHRSRPAPEIRDALLKELRAFSGSAPQSDDITLVVIRVL